MLSPLLIIIGLLIGLIGRQFFAYTLGFIGFLLGAGSTYLIFTMTNLLDSTLNELSTDFVISDDTWGTWLKVLLSIICGVFIGFCLIKMQYIGACVIGAFIGISLALPIY